MRKRGIAAAGGAAALIVLMGAGPAAADAAGSVKEKVVGPGDTIHVTATGCDIDTPWLSAPFTRADNQKWKKTGDGAWTGEVPVTKWGVFSPHPKTKTSVSLMCAGSGPVEIPITWDPNHKGDSNPTPTTRPTPTKKPSPRPTTSKPSFRVNVTPRYFHAGDTLHVSVHKCPSKPTVHSQILTGGAHWVKKNGVWKTPVKVRSTGLRTGYYKFTVRCKGFNPVVFKVRYGHPSGGNDDGNAKPAKHNPNGQTKYIPNGGPETGGGSTARTFV